MAINLYVPILENFQAWLGFCNQIQLLKGSTSSEKEKKEVLNRTKQGI